MVLICNRFSCKLDIRIVKIRIVWYHNLLVYHFVNVDNLALVRWHSRVYVLKYINIGTLIHLDRVLQICMGVGDLSVVCVRVCIIVCSVCCGGMG